MHARCYHADAADAGISVNIDRLRFLRDGFRLQRAREVESTLDSGSARSIVPAITRNVARAAHASKADHAKRVDSLAAAAVHGLFLDVICTP